MFVAAPIMGAIIERVLMRKMADAPLVAQLVTTIGLMLMLMGLAATIWDPQDSRHIDRFFGIEGFHIGETLMPWSRFITIVAGLVLAIGLKFLLSRTRLGVAMRAVVDNRELAALNGVRPGRSRCSRGRSGRRWRRSPASSSPRSSPPSTCRPSRC